MRHEPLIICRLPSVRALQAFGEDAALEPLDSVESLDVVHRIACRVMSGLCTGCEEGRLFVGTSCRENSISFLCGGVSFTPPVMS